MPISLPTERTRPPLDASRLMILLYGSPKIGKSTFCARFPRGLFLATEPGLAHLDTYSIPIRAWGDVLDAIGAIGDDPHKFSPIIIDTADRLWDLACAEVARKAGVDIVGDIGYGRGIERAQGLYKNAIMALASLDVGLVFTSHAQAVTLQPPGLEKQTKWAPTLAEKALNIVAPLVDIVLYAASEPAVDKKTGAHVDMRVAHASPSPLWIAGDRTGRLAPSFPFSFHKFMEFFTETGAESAQNTGAGNAKQV